MSTRRVICGVAILAIALGVPATGRSEEEGVDEELGVSIVPQPVLVERNEGFYEGSTQLRSVFDAALEEVSPDGDALADWSAEGRPLRLVLDGAEERLGDEGYLLDVTLDGIVARARTRAGLHHALQTLRQLLPAEFETTANPTKRAWRIPCCHVEDRPRFAWRGMHLDVGRHFFTADEVKRFLDLLALFKFNTFHWHLTEDQGWRIQIAKYPKLTEVGAFRTESPKAGDRTQGDGKPYGGFYTQDEIRGVVAHARARHITIVPEIEMPGHAQAAIAAYPELGNTDEEVGVRTRWGVSRHVYNVEDSTFEFLEAVLEEVLALFPGEFVHVGGDECPKHEWKASAKAQARMKAEGLDDEHELQSWFIRRIERHLDAKGRRLIGWDEIHEGGLAPNAAMMVWRNVKYGVDAVRQRHDVVMSPTSHCYFDYYQGDRAHEPEAIGGLLPLERVYAFEPVPSELTEEEAAHVLGAQANLWSEYIPTFEHLTYMAFPRAAAMAEVVWSPAESRDFGDFQRRWQHAAARLDVLGVNHRREAPRPRAELVLFGDRGEVAFEDAAPGQTIRYTLDGRVPDEGAQRYEGPIQVTATGVVTAAAFGGGGGRSAPVTVDVVRWVPVDPGPLEAGLRLQGYRGAFDRVPDFSTRAPDWEADVDGFVFSGREPGDDFALRHTGWLRVETPGVFTFEVGSDDGSVLTLAGARLVSNDGLHGHVVRRGRVHLERGLYPIELGYFERGGAESLTVVRHGAATLLRPVTRGR